MTARSSMLCEGGATTSRGMAIRKQCTKSKRPMLMRSMFQIKFFDKGGIIFYPQMHETSWTLKLKLSNLASRQFKEEHRIQKSIVVVNNGK